MPGPPRSCNCGDCRLCKRRRQLKESADRKRYGIPPIPVSDNRRQAANIRWGKVFRSVQAPQEIEEVFVDDGVSDEELDRRALEKWRPEWTQR